MQGKQSNIISHLLQNFHHACTFCTVVALGQYCLLGKLIQYNMGNALGLCLMRHKPKAFPILYEQIHSCNHSFIIMPFPELFRQLGMVYIEKINVKEFYVSYLTYRGRYNCDYATGVWVCGCVQVKEFYVSYLTYRGRYNCDYAIGVCICGCVQVLCVI